MGGEWKSPNPLILLVPGEGVEPSRGEVPRDFKSPERENLPLCNYLENQTFLFNINLVSFPTHSARVSWSQVD